MVAFSGVVVDDVEDHLDARAVQRLHHRTEFRDLLPARAGGVAWVGREEAEGVVAPIVDETSFVQVAVGDEVVHGQELDRGDPEIDQVLQHGAGREAEVGPTQRLRNPWVPRRHALHVAFVDDGPTPRRARRPIVSPSARWIDDDRSGHARRAVRLAHGEVSLFGTDLIAEDRVVRTDLAGDAARVWIDDQLVGVEAVAALGLPGPVHAVSVELTGAQLWKVAVPYGVGAFAQRHALLAPRIVEQAQIDGSRVFGEEGEVDAFAIPGRSQGRRADRARPASVHAPATRHSFSR